MKAILLAAGLSLGSATLAGAQAAGAILDTPLPLSGAGLLPLSALYVNAPSGATTLGTIPFNLGGWYSLMPGQSASMAFKRMKDPIAAYVLLNSGNTFFAYANRPAGRVRLTFSDGSFQDTALIVGSNIREWRTGAAAFTVTTLSSPDATNVWTGQAINGGGTAVLDMLTVTVAPTKAALTGISVTNTVTPPPGTPPLGIIFAGVTVRTDPPVATKAGGDDEDEDEDHDGQGHHDQDKHDAALAPAAREDSGRGAESD